MQGQVNTFEVVRDNRDKLKDFVDLVVERKYGSNRGQKKSKPRYSSSSNKTQIPLFPAKSNNSEHLCHPKYTRSFILRFKLARLLP